MTAAIPSGGTPRMRSSLALLAATLLLASRVDAQTDSVEQRIARIEHGLLPRVVDKGKRGVGMSLEARLREQHVPGLSVAVINEGAVEWARAWGVTEAGTDQRVTPDTRFQAGSISKPV